MIEFILYIFVTAITPGPNCIVSLSNASQKGFPKCMTLNLGMFAGTATVDVIAYLLVWALISVIPSVKTVLQVLGIVYLLYLSYCLATKGQISIGSKSGDFKTGFLMQFVNVKVLMLGVTAVSMYVLDIRTSGIHGLFVTLIIPAICLFCSTVWALAGAALSGIYNKNTKIFNIGFALVLGIQAVINAVKLISSL